jgi:hypothetical protein
MLPRERLFVAAAAAVLAVLLTWPIAPRMASAGRVHNGDGRFSVWNVAWVARALTTDPLRVFDANIFYPETGTLAYSEANLVAGALAVPAWLITRNIYATSNFAILASFFLAAFTAYALGRRLTGSRSAATIVGLSYAFCPFVFAHIPHIQLLMTFGPAMALLAMHRLVDEPTMGRAVWLGVALAVQALACTYYGIFGGLAVALGFVWFGALDARLRTWRFWRCAFVALMVAAALLTPFLLEYLPVLQAGFVRSLQEARLFSVRGPSYLASSMWVHTLVLPFMEGFRDVLFPGFLTLALAITACWYAFGRPRGVPFATSSRRLVGFYVLLLGLAVWASFGPDAGLYAWLYKAIPLFSYIRVPSRFGVLVILSASVLAGFGVAAILGRLGVWPRRAFVAGAVTIALAESIVIPLQIHDAPPVAQAYRTLAALPWGAVAEFPFYYKARDRYRHTEYMLMSTHHWKPLVNGYSDHTPEDYVEDLPKLASFPLATAWEPIRRRNVRYIVVHWKEYNALERSQIQRVIDHPESPVRQIVHDQGVSLFETIARADD